MRKAIVTGVTGQDGFYLARHLLQNGYQVIGIDRRTSLPTDGRLTLLRGTPNFVIVPGDITDISSIKNHIVSFQPDEFYHLAAQSDVGVSWNLAINTAEITGVGTLNCLEALRQDRPDCRFYFAGSSEQFGNATDDALDETSVMQPESPYAAAKVFGYDISQVYRRSYDMFISCGILFNHESPIRGENFVTRKITQGLARVKHGLATHVELGNMDAKRDWGFAGDYVRAMHAILQLDEPDNFVIGTGNTYSVREFFVAACKFFDLDPDQVYKVNPKYMRPNDVKCLQAKPDKAKQILNWEPSVDFDGLVAMMCNYDYCLESPHDSERRQAEQYLFPQEVTRERTGV